MNKVELHILIDVNVYINALKGKPVVSTVGGLYSAMPLLTEIAAAPEGVAHLTDSDHVLDLLEVKLQEILDYSEEEAGRLVSLVADVSRVTRGVYVDLENGRREAIKVERKIPKRFLGNGKGQIDHEDLQVLGAARSAISGAPSEEMALTVTSDGGFFNVSAHVSADRIHVSHAREAIAAVRAAVAHAR